jgi:hypothetical protein
MRWDRLLAAYLDPDRRLGVFPTDEAASCGFNALILSGFGGF